MKETLKLIVIGLALTLITATGYSQKKFSTSISMGKVFPLGKFSSTNQLSNNSGYAKSGFTLNIDGDYHVHNRLALSLRFNMGNTSIDDAEFRKRLIDETKDYIDSTDLVQYNINYWQWISPMIGVKYNYPIIINQLYAEVGAFTGLNLIQIPDQNIYFDDLEIGRTVYSQNVGDTDITFPIALNIGLRYRLNKKLQLKAFSEYFHTTTTFDHVTYYKMHTGVSPIEISKYEFTVPLQTLNFSLGVVYSL